MSEYQSVAADAATRVNGQAAVKETQVSRILLVAGQFADWFTLEDLIVRVWASYPSIFGLAGYVGSYPDSHKVKACVYGNKGLIKCGYLEPDPEFVGQQKAGRFRVTEVGKQVVKTFYRDQA